MNAFRRFITRVTLGGCLGAALAAGPGFAQSVDTPRLEIGSPRGPASTAKSKVKATSASRYNVWEEDDAAEAAAAAQRPPKEVHVPREMKEIPVTREVASPRAMPEPQRKPQRPGAYTPVGKRASPVGFVPRHQRVVGAQHLGDEKSETLPAPSDSLDLPGIGGQPPGEPIPDANAPGVRRSIISGRNGTPVGPNGVPSGPPGAPMGPHGAPMGAHGGSHPMIMGEEIEGGIPFGGNPFQGDMGEGGCVGCGGGDCGGGDCGGGDCGGGACGADWVGPFGGRFRECFPCLFVNLQNLDIFSGVHGFTNNTNRAGAGSFGYQFGFNKGRPVVCLPCTNLSWQIGVSGVFSNFDGATFNNNGALATTPLGRNQFFLTGGIFRRVDWGLQFGIVFDYLHEDWYANMDLGQVRGELSWVYPSCHEIGFWFATGVNPGRDNNAQVFVNGVPAAPQVETWEAADLYAFFYRYRFSETGGQARSFGGFTGDGDGLVGGDFIIPVSNNWSFQAEYTYLLPKDNGARFMNVNEAWNIGINMVWSPGLCRNLGQNDYNRPLLNVANNGNFILKRRP